VGEERHSGWVLERLGRATRWVRAAKILYRQRGRRADLPRIYPQMGGGGRGDSLFGNDTKSHSVITI
jgi:hypothetical protein